MDALSNWQIQITMVIALHAPLDGLVSTLDLLEHTPEKADILLITKSVKNLEMDGPKFGLKKEKFHMLMETATGLDMTMLNLSTTKLIWQRHMALVVSCGGPLILMISR